MTRHAMAAATLALLFIAAPAAAARWPAAKSPAIPETSGFVVIPNAAVPPERAHVYKAIYDATRAAEKPSQVLPALDMAGSELNALAVSKIPLRNARFVVVFHGSALDGILDDAHYRAKYGVSNPNLAVLRRFQRAGVEMFVCGQNLAFEDRDPRSIAREVKVASDALIVLMKYQNSGYALLSY
jgi:intracellular sulfur oxidation DsrE/DsrF family protein